MFYTIRMKNVFLKKNQFVYIPVSEHFSFAKTIHYVDMCECIVMEGGVCVFCVLEFVEVSE